MQAEYWRQRKNSAEQVVEYGNDVEGTAFDSRNDGDPLSETDWNLQVRSLAGRNSHACQPMQQLSAVDPEVLQALASRVCQKA